MVRKSARAIIIKDGGFILIHRIKEKEGKLQEYYVFPGGGIEENETCEEAVIREVLEELGIIIKPQKRLYGLKSNNSDETFLLCNYIGGEIGTGTGPEFNSPEYKNRGLYIPKIVPLDRLKEIDVLKPIKKAIIQDMNDYNNLENAIYRNLKD